MCAPCFGQHPQSSVTSNANLQDRTVHAGFGMETETCFIGGAANRDIDSIAEWLAGKGFNAVRVPLAADAILSPTGHPCTNKGDQDGLRANNMVFGSLSYMKQLAQLVQVAADAGLLVLLDMHVLRAGMWPDGGAVAPSERSTLFAAWDQLASELCDPDRYWNIMGADLKNEPYSMFWGEPAAGAPSQHYRSSDRWDTLASQLGSHILQRCPRWAIFVQGVGHCRTQHDPTAPGTAPPCDLASAPGQQDMGLQAGTWWGENLQGAAASPIDVGEVRPHLGKVIYSPHTYGPGTGPQKQFTAASFPTNMPAIWDKQWGHLARRNLAPVIIGEFGGHCTGPDLTLNQALVSYISSHGIGGFWWSLNPDSSDTGGLVTTWDSLGPETVKIGLLHSLPATRVPRTNQRDASHQQSSHVAGEPHTAPHADPAPAPFFLPPFPPPSPSPPPPSPRAISLDIVTVPATGADFILSSMSWPPPSPSPPFPQLSPPAMPPVAQVASSVLAWGSLYAIILCCVVGVCNYVREYLRQLDRKLALTAPMEQAATTQGRPKPKAKVKPPGWKSPLDPASERLAPGQRSRAPRVDFDDLAEMDAVSEDGTNAKGLSGLAEALAAADAAAAAVGQIKSRDCDME